MTRRRRRARSPPGLVPGRADGVVAAVAVFLPLRTSAPEGLADLADGLAEEIIDALTATRGLRVRPLASIRKAYSADADPRDIGAALSLAVEVVVEASSLRASCGDIIRISARAIGVTDGFQLSADRIDAKPADLLDAGDAIAKAVARALTVELAPEPPASAARKPIHPRATELYLEAKARMRADWIPQRPALDGRAARGSALALAPDDPPILATVALALARRGVLLLDGRPAPRAPVRRARRRARTRRGRGVARARGDVAVARAILRSPRVRRTPARAVKCSPGNALAQAGLGAMLLEVGAEDDALAHLEASVALDPTATVPAWDLARANVYRGDWAFAERLVRISGQQHEHTYVDTTFGRFEMWRGKRYDARPFDPASVSNT